jgi:integrase/recombinase XerD
MSTDLRHAARDYVALRRALGYQLRGYDRFLDDLVADLQRAAAATLTIELAVAWATKPADAPPFRWKARLGIARGFARYLQTLDPTTQVPPTNLLAFHRRSRPAPYLYSPTEIQALLDATDTLTPTLRAATYRTLLGLLAVTGMRVGEALALDRDNIDLRERRLMIVTPRAAAGSCRCTLQPRASSSATRVFATSSVGRRRRRASSSRPSAPGRSMNASGRRSPNCAPSPG